MVTSWCMSIPMMVPILRSHLGETSRPFRMADRGRSRFPRRLPPVQGRQQRSGRHPGKPAGSGCLEAIGRSLRGTAGRAVSGLPDHTGTIAGVSCQLPRRRGQCPAPLAHRTPDPDQRSGHGSRRGSNFPWGVPVASCRRGHSGGSGKSWVCGEKLYLMPSDDVYGLSQEPR